MEFPPITNGKFVLWRLVLVLSHGPYMRHKYHLGEVVEKQSIAFFSPKATTLGSKIVQADLVPTLSTTYFFSFFFPVGPKRPIHPQKWHGGDKRGVAKQGIWMMQVCGDF